MTLPRCQLNLCVMYIPITFKNFDSEESFLNLQNKFSILDERSNPYEPEVNQKVIKKDFNIIIKELNPITYKDVYQSRSFYNDFLFKAIDNLSKRYLSFLSKQFENTVFLDKDKIRLFAIKEKDKFINVGEVFKTANYLDSQIYDKLEIQIDIIIEHLTEVHIHQNSNLEEKLKFKLGKGVVLVLFAMLREKKYIDAPYNVDFGKFIDDNFLWWDKKEKNYKPFKKSNKLISDYINYNKSLKNPLKVLEELLTDKSFYNFPYS